MHKRHDGRNEPIVDPELPIIDAHHHLMDKKGVRYLLGDIVDDVSAGHNIIATVYVESHSMMRADGPELIRPVGETEFANGIAAMSASGGYGPCRINSAIVAFADLSAGSQVAETLDAHIAAGGNRFRGIRQVAIWHPSPDPYRFIMTRPVKDLMTGVGFRAGFSQLAKRGLSFDAAVFHPQLGELAGLADEFPDTPIVLNHLGFAMAMGTVESARKEVFKIWRSSLRELARRPNVMVKVGGLGMPFWGFGFEERKGPVGFEELAETWAPYVETGIEIFGADRCMMQSNFPADGHSCGYVPLWNALKTIVKSYSPADKAKLFSRTASRVYNIPIDFAADL
jgi:L-fuconolactonase